MPQRDKRIDAYIAKAQPFARPILEHLRETVHAACPDVQETLKWSHPSFEYKGIMCGMASFKEHCTFGFWKSALILGDGASGDAMGQFGRITSVKDLPSKRVMSGYIEKAMQLNEEGVAAPRAIRSKVPKPVLVPPELSKALAKKKKALAAFEAMSPSHRREYCEWIDEAKRPETKATRVEKTIALLLEGKSLNAKYDRTKSA